MGPRDTLHFDKEAYRKKIEGLSLEQLTKKYQKKTISINSTCFGIGVGVATALPTFGASLITTPYFLRQTVVLRGQACIIEQVLRSRDDPEPRTRKRDVLAGLTIGAASCLVGFEVGIEATEHLSKYMCPTDVGVTASGATVAAHHGAEGVTKGLTERVTERVTTELTEVVAIVGVRPVEPKHAVTACSKAIGLASGNAASEIVRAGADKVLGNSCTNVK